ncbi:unnamed protein product (macronuclear) [Paramecium tetraurelia]|uniref:NET domain-containing protein n=1 Tax=Paramecium tetraurelia TaxID=5888 RepID=A0BBP1_PARTE|nr:uncharacterized protein GSPATT00000393001 [Paramecium tetraurelia]CAK55958.1 unnamed protein product [Paramecium tetraurelia]|eukprot:XP_001423356.1 hypothetical protein (macronuclear) [Paramecium tetraurelia strain d4-2]
MKKNCKTRQYSFQITITKKAFLNFKNQYQDQKSKILEQNQGIQSKHYLEDNDLTKRDVMAIINQPEQMKKNTISMSKFDKKLLNSLNQLETFLDRSEKEDTPLILAKKDENMFKYFVNNEDDNGTSVSS